ncbi:MAG TPA: T9SS type A sorting domain-containing protein, partial [Rhodothermales bacterium]|nr:T9SS type A sorting domain-containing protein [Rhodothermales bacterium]
SRYGFCVVRLLSDGSLDPAFGTGGVTVVSFSSLNYVGAVALQPDGKIVVVGTTTYTNGKRNVTVVRYLPDGALDPSFGDAGRVTVSFSGSTEGRGVLLQPDGRIVVSGGGTAGTMGPFLLARLLPDGTPDLTFGPGGQRTPLGGTTAADLALLPDGRIVAAGTSSNAFAVVRLQESGITDASFGSGGVARIPGFFSGDSTVNGVAVDAEGRVVVAGCASGESGRTVYLTRFKADGTPDPSFDGRGAVDPAAATSDCAYGVAVQPDGRVVVAGWGTAGSSRRIAVARFLTNGTLDPSFGSGGRLFFLPVGQTSFTVLALALQADGRIVLAGCNANDQLGLVRLLPDGTLDPAFGAGGLAAVGEGCARALAIQPDGRIVAAGAVTYRIPGDPSDAYYKGRLVRVLSSGAPDPSFGTTGGVTADLSATAAFNAVALQADGRIVVGGSTGSMILGPYFFALARYEADGTRDLTFGGSGTVQPFSSGSAATGLAALPDGRLLAAGAASGFAFVRTLSDGTLDPTFDGDGRVTTAAGAGASALTLLPDGRFVAAGTARTLFGYDVAAARYLGDGVTPAEPGSAPTALTLTAAPNPVRGTAAVRYGLPAGAAVRLALYDALGREVAVLADGVQAAGTHEAALDAAALAPGVYVLRLAAGADARVMRVSVVR